MQHGELLAISDPVVLDLVDARTARMMSFSWWLIDLAVASLVGGIGSYVYWDLVTMRHWRTGPHAEAYVERLAERDRRRPYDEAWTAWLTEVRHVAAAELLLADFERQVAALWARSEQSRLAVRAG